MRIFVYPYKPSSESAKLLATKIGGKLIKHTNSKYKPKATDVIINWGSASIPEFPVAKILNANPIGNKLEFFQQITKAGLGDCVPPWTTDKNVALEWLSEGYLVVGRALLNSHSGKGIILANNAVDLHNVPLYTQYIKKAREYRVYWVKGASSSLIKQKLKKTGESHSKIQNLDNGYVYGSVNHELSPVVVETAAKVAQAFDMDFGAIDIVWNKHYNKAYVLEINSAPGMVDSTADYFVNTFKSVIVK